MLDAVGLLEPVDTSSNTVSLEMDGNGAVDTAEDGAKVPQGSSADDESKGDDKEDDKEEQEEKDEAHEDEHEDDDPGSSENESTLHSSTPLSLFPRCVFPPKSFQAKNSDVLFDIHQSLEPGMLLKNNQWINGFGKSKVQSNIYALCRTVPNFLISP